MSERELPEDARNFVVPTESALEKSPIAHALVEHFPNSGIALREKNKETHLQMSEDEFLTVTAEQHLSSCEVPVNSAASVPDNVDLLTSRQYGCVVAVIMNKGRRLLAHIPPNNLKRSSIGFMYHGSSPEEQDELVTETVAKLSTLLGTEIAGAEGVLLCNIASEKVFPEKHEYHYQNQTALWKRLQTKLEAQGANIGILESALGTTSVYIPADSKDILLTGYKSTNSEKFGEVIEEETIVQQSINLEKSSKEVSLLPHTERTAPERRPLTEEELNEKDPYDF